MWMCQNISKGWYTFDTHENYPVFKTLQHPCLSTPKNFPLPWPWMSNFRWAPSLKMITNQLKKNINKGRLLYVVKSFLRLAFTFSINSLILSGFPLIYFHLDEASLSTYSWLYTLLTVVVQKYHKMYFIHIYSAHFAIKICFICKTWKRKKTMEQKSHHTCARMKSKTN